MNPVIVRILIVFLPVAAPIFRASQGSEGSVAMPAGRLNAAKLNPTEQPENPMKTGILTAILILLLAACSKITLENYDRLQAGMSYDEVKGILGTPDQCSEVLGVKACTWGKEKRNIKVNFVSNQVLIFSAEGIR